MTGEYVIRGSLFHLLDDPSRVDNASSYQYIEDAAVWVRDGHIHAVESWQRLAAGLPKDITCIDRRGCLITPGFIDTHAHFPQTAIIGSYGESLLEWLENYAFPEEKKFSDLAYAETAADEFLDELLRNGTTTALVFCTVHRQSVEAFFGKAAKRGLRMIAGKVLMDRNAPAELTDSAESAYHDCSELIGKWHGKGRLHYAVTPRFAPTSSSKQLHAAGRLLQENKGVYLHTHVSENDREIEWVRQLFPEAANYVDVYRRHGLVGSRSVFAHAIHLDDDEVKCLRRSDAAVSFCPTSNTFLGSGLFDHDRLSREGLRIGMGTDIGGGTSFSMFATLCDAYKVLRLRGDRLHPLRAFYLATLGGARALSLDSLIGNLEPGKEADFAVVDCGRIPLLRRRLRGISSIEEILFSLIVLGDDRVVRETYSGGSRVWPLSDC